MCKIHFFYIMRNLFVYIVFFSALVVSGCSSEEDAVSQSTLDPNVVAFSTNGQKGMTRSGATVTSLTTFNVWSSTADGNAYIGALDGSGEAFTYDALSEVFKSDVNHYWPSVGTLNFFASNGFKEMYEYHTDVTPHDAVVNYINEGIRDIVCATVRTGTKTIPYPLLFHHVLSQVKVTVEAKDKTQDLQYRVVGITMTTQDVGRYYYATSTGGIGTWGLINAGSTRAYAFGANMPAVFEKDGRFASTDYWNVLPCVNDLVFSIQYQVIQNGVVISDFTGANAKTVTVSSPGLLSEKKYTYNFKLGIDNDDVITFTLEMSDWTDGGTTDMDVPEIPPTSVSLNTSTLKSTLNTTPQKLVTTIEPEDANPNVEYSTSDPEVAIVDSEGNITTTGYGHCTLTVKSEIDPTIKDDCEFVASDDVVRTTAKRNTLTKIKKMRDTGFTEFPLWEGLTPCPQWNLDPSKAPVFEVVIKYNGEEYIGKSDDNMMVYFDAIPIYLSIMGDNSAGTIGESCGMYFRGCSDNDVVTLEKLYINGTEVTFLPVKYTWNYSELPQIYVDEDAEDAGSGIILGGISPEINIWDEIKITYTYGNSTGAVYKNWNEAYSSIPLTYSEKTTTLSVQTYQSSYFGTQYRLTSPSLLESRTEKYLDLGQEQTTTKRTVFGVIKTQTGGKILHLLPLPGESAALINIKSISINGIVIYPAE